MKMSSDSQFVIYLYGVLIIRINSWNFIFFLLFFKQPVQILLLLSY